MENRRKLDAKVDSKKEEEIEEEHDVEEIDLATRMISYLRNRGTTRVEVSYHDANMRADVLIDWIGELERYFDYENVQDPNQVRYSCTKLKGHATIWWDMLQKDIVNN